MTIHDSVRTYIVDELRVRVSEIDLRDDYPLLDKEVLWPVAEGDLELLSKND